MQATVFSAQSDVPRNTLIHFRSDSMAKQELRRKILATIATVGGLCCALAVCVWLLLTSSMFSTSIQILMLVCTGGIAAATILLCIAKIS